MLRITQNRMYILMQQLIYTADNLYRIRDEYEWGTWAIPLHIEFLLLLLNVDSSRRVREFF